jgi:hypothetical protein
MIPTENGCSAEVRENPRHSVTPHSVTLVTEQIWFVSLEMVNRESAFEKFLESGFVLDQERGAMDFNELLALKTRK